MEPRLVPGDVRYAHFSLGLAHLCGISIEGDTYCWGDNEPVVPIRQEPTLVRGGHEFVALGDLNRGYLALDRFGDVYSWGPESYVPRKETSGFSFVTFSGRFSAGAGFGHLCALDREGVAYCWGHNESGQLGDGTTEQRAVPTKVSPPRQQKCAC